MLKLQNFGHLMWRVNSLEKSDAGKHWGQEKAATEDEMVGWHHRLNGHEFEQTLGDSEGQGSLACCIPWGCKELDMTEWLHFHVLEKEKATHSSVPAWRIPGTGEPGGLPSMGLHRVGHDWSDLAAAASNWTTEIPTCVAYVSKLAVLSCSVMSDSLEPHGL